MRYLLRPAEPGDLPALLAIDAACFEADIRYSRREMVQFMSLPGAGTLVAEALDPRTARGPGQAPPALAGFILAVAQRRGGHIITLDVLPEHRRAGLGRRLMEAAETQMLSSGAVMVQLEAAVNNAPALAFYRRLGYRAVKKLPGYYPGGLDGLMLVKDLSAPRRSMVATPADN